MTARMALRFAFYRAITVLVGGLVAIGLYVLLISFGPQLEGRIFPVVDLYALVDVRAEENGGISFSTRFEKERDCYYYGVSWFAPDERGDLARIQLMPLTADPTAPMTGPVGPRVGRRNVLYPPAGTTQLFAVMHHACGWPWQTRTVIGPFPIGEDGLPFNPPELVARIEERDRQQQP